MAKTWSDCFDYILPNAPGCGQDVATIALRNAVMDFYEETGILTATITPITTVAGTAVYTVPVPAGYTLAWVRGAWLNGNRIDPMAEDDIAKRNYNWQAQTGTPFNYFLPDSNSIQLYPAPDAFQLNYTGALTLRAVLKPSRSATGISEDWIFIDWVDVIAYGALARLCAMPAKPWTNPAMAVEYGRLYKDGRANAKIDANRSLTRAPLQVRFNTAIYG